MATTQFNARNGLSVGTTPVSILDASGNASFISASLAANGGLTIASGAPGVTTNALYQVGSTLYWNGSTIGGTTLPSQSGNGGKFLTTDGSVLSWATVTGGGGGDGYSDFTASCTGASAVVTMTAARVTVRNSAGASIELSNVSETLTLTSTGAGGLDTGSLAASTWYYIFFIYNPTTADVAALASLSANSPTLPSGYTYFRRMGALRTDATANKYPLRMAWSDDSAEYRPYKTGSNLTNWPTIQTGALGTVGVNPTFSSVAVTSFFPPTASRIRFLHGNVWGNNNADQIGIESGTNGSYVLSCASGEGGKRLVEINYIASIGVAAESGTDVMAVGWVDHGGPIYGGA